MSLWSGAPRTFAYPPSALKVLYCSLKEVSLSGGSRDCLVKSCLYIGWTFDCFLFVPDWLSLTTLRRFATYSDIFERFKVIFEFMAVVP